MILCPRCALNLTLSKVERRAVLTCSTPGCFKGSLKDIVLEHKTKVLASRPPKAPKKPKKGPKPI